MPGNSLSYVLISAVCGFGRGRGRYRKDPRLITPINRPYLKIFRNAFVIGPIWIIAGNISFRPINLELPARSLARLSSKDAVAKKETKWAARFRDNDSPPPPPSYSSPPPKSSSLSPLLAMQARRCIRTRVDSYDSREYSYGDF